MNIGYNVTIRPIRHRPEKNKQYQVRWVIEGASKTFTKSFMTSPLADGFRSELVQAANKGEAFDLATGLPLSRLRAENQRRKSVSWYRHATEYVDYKWPRVSGHQRVSIAETLVAATCALIPMRDAPGGRKAVRTALKRWAFNKKTREENAPPADVQKALDWVASVSPPLSDLADPQTVSTVLDEFARKLDGRPAAPHYLSRRSRVFYNVLKYAVARERLDAHPLDNPRLSWEPPTDQREVVQEVDPRVVGSTAQLAGMLAAVSYVGRGQGPRFVAFFGCLYYAMLRPEEAAGLTDSGCELPEQGWGLLHVEETRSAVGRDWTDTGEVHDERGLKQRSRKATRPVPIPPELVALLRWHLATYGVDPDGRIFRSVNGKPIHPSTYSTVWRKAREFGLAPKDRRSMVLKRPYDLRHAGVTARLFAGIPDRQVAEWAGHSVEILRRIYSKILAGFDTQWHARMDLIFRTAKPEENGRGEPSG